MTNKSILLEEISEGLFMINDNSPLIQMIDFSYILHLMLIESGFIKANEWEEFAFSINLKIIERAENFVFISKTELSNLIQWFDWICRVIVVSEGEHNNTFFIKNFLSESDNLFNYFKSGKHREIIIEKIKQKKAR
jgi:hypothetical protein